MQLSEFLSGFLKKKGAVLALLLLAVGIVLIFFGTASSADKDSAAAEESLEEYKTRMEKELSELCSSLEGVGKCKVSLSFSKGRENSYKNGMLTESKPPVVLGVAVACRGADSQRVRAELTELFTALFDIPSTRVAILKLN